MNTARHICMVGTGYVGLVTGAGLARLGHQVTCVDINARLIAGLKDGKIPFYETNLPELVTTEHRAGRLRFTTSLAESLEEARYIFIAVATPQDSEGTPDLSQLHKVIDDLANLISKPVLIIVKSTVPAGVFKELQARLEQRLVEGRDFQLVSCPEFLAEGSAVHDFFHPARTIVGADREATAREVCALFSRLGGKRIYTTPNSAQLVKYASNAFLASRVAFINEISKLCERLQVDVDHVSEAVLLDPRFGQGYLTAGIGFSGPCLPKDLGGLRHNAVTVGLHTPFFDAIARQNDDHLRRVVDVITAMCPAGGRIAMYGLSFKAGTSDVRNSHSLELVSALAARGYSIVGTDPQALEAAASVLGKLTIKLVADPYDAARDTDLQAFMVAWPEYASLDLAKLRRVVNAPRIFDGPRLISFEKAKAAGFEYRGIGRFYRDPTYFVSEDPTAEGSGSWNCTGSS